MDETAKILFALGAILLLGMATDYLGRRTFLPRVTLLLILGICLGDDGLALLPEALNSSFDLVAEMALMMIGFLLGGRLTLSTLRNLGRQIAWISVSAAFGTMLIVAVALFAAGLPLEIAILLGSMASATAPAATVDTVMESKRQTGFTTILLAVVAIDDAWALVLFSLALALLVFFSGTQAIYPGLLHAQYQIGGGLLLGALIGVPAAYLTGRLRPGQPLLTEALGLVFFCGGAAILLDVSFLIAVMTMGAAIANLSRHHEYAFHEIENVEWPFLAVFFVLAGASLEIRFLPEIGIAGLVYIVARSVGKVLGGWLGGWAGKADRQVRNWIGPALLPQAGVAIGMGLIAAGQHPEYRDVILPVLIGTTVIFELFGPVLTRLAIARTSQ